MPPAPLLVLLVEDTEFTRVGLRLFLAGSGFHLVEATNVQDALALAAVHPLDVAVIDLVLPPSPGAEPDYQARSGLELIHRIKTRFPRLGIVVLSAHPEQGAAVREMVRRGRWSGVAYLLKGGPATEVEQAIHLVQQGGLHFAPAVSLADPVPRSRAILDALDPAERQVVVEALAGLDRLTPRQLEVLRQVGASAGLQEAADALNITYKALDNHLARICARLGLDQGQATRLRRGVLLAKIALLHGLEADRYREGET